MKHEIQATEQNTSNPPEVSSQANGWWWINIEGDWCIARVQFRGVFPRDSRADYLAVTILTPAGQMISWDTSAPGKEKWGGRVVVPPL